MRRLQMSLEQVLYTSDDDQYFVYTYDDCAVSISVEGQ
jgi:hypothetical protein